VRGLKRAADLAEQAAQFARLERLLVDGLGHALAFEKLHDEVVAAVGQLAEGEDVDDVGVLDAVGRARLLDECAEFASCLMVPPVTFNLLPEQLYGK
jgi:hypothetical protein